MDEATRKQFDEILRQEPGSLRETDLAFLRSRESYLTADQRERFAEVLEVKSAEEDAETTAEEPKKTKKKSE